MCMYMCVRVCECMCVCECVYVRMCLCGYVCVAPRPSSNSERKGTDAFHNHINGSALVDLEVQKKGQALSAWLWPGPHGPGWSRGPAAGAERTDEGRTGAAHAGCVQTERVASVMR